MWNEYPVIYGIFDSDKNTMYDVAAYGSFMQYDL